MKAVLVLAGFLVFSHAGHAADMDLFLASGRWCFEDTQGPWDHGRIQFTYEPRGVSTAHYDVTDAPGRGGTHYVWRTYWTPFALGWRISLKAGGRPEVRADIRVENNNSMIWYFLDSPPSRLRRCS